MIAITSVGGRTSGVGDHARLMARASANGGHGNDRPTQCIEVGLTTLGQPRLSEALNPTSMQESKLKGEPETG